MTKMTQRQKILDYCEKYGFITNRDAVTKLNINSPTKRISEINKSGLYDVQTEEVRKTNSSGEKVKYFKYYISPVKQGSVQP